MSSSPPPEPTGFAGIPEPVQKGTTTTESVRAESGTPHASAPEPSQPTVEPTRRAALAARLSRVRGAIRPWSAWTLRAKLVASMIVLFTALSLITGAFTVVALDRYLTSQVDQQLTASIERQTGPGPGGSSLPGGDEAPRGPGDEGLWAVIGDIRYGIATKKNKDRAELTDAQYAVLESASAGVGRNAKDVDLGGYFGTYRIMAARGTIVSQGVRVPITYVVGLPTAPQDQTIATTVAIVVTTVGVGTLLMAGLGTLLVRRNLKPLERVAATATRVSRIPLRSGQVALAERVAPPDIDLRTEVGQVGAALNEMLDHVDDALNARHRSEQRVRQFVADASHELRTPLASIKGYAELSRREPAEVPKSLTHAMRRIESEANRMSSLVEDLLLLARLDAGRPLEAAPVDLSMLVVNAVSDAHAAAPHHRWDLDLPAEPIEVNGDGARLHQVVANLLANARTHTPEGTRVTTSVRPEGDWVRLSVHDDGPGVPEVLQPNVFERFARGDDARNRVGGSTGLGLSIVHAVSKAHGGRVELSSVPGDTTFSLLIPAV